MNNSEDDIDWDYFEENDDYYWLSDIDDGIRHLISLVNSLYSDDYKEQTVASSELKNNHDIIILFLKNIIENPDDYGRKQDAVWILSELYESKKVKELLEIALKDKDKQIRLEALNSIENTGEVDIDFLLQIILNDADINVRVKSIELFLSFDFFEKSDLKQFWLILQKDSSLIIRCHVATLLYESIKQLKFGNIFEKIYYQLILRRIIRILVKILKKEKPNEILAELIYSLGRIDKNKKIIDILLFHLNKNPDPYIRYLVMNVFYYYNNDKVINSLITIVRNDAELESLRFNAIRILSGFKEHRIADLFIEILKGKPHKKIELEICRALHEFNDVTYSEKIIEELICCLKSNVQEQSELETKICEIIINTLKAFTKDISIKQIQDIQSTVSNAKTGSIFFQLGELLSLVGSSRESYLAFQKAKFPNSPIKAKLSKALSLKEAAETEALNLENMTITNQILQDSLSKSIKLYKQSIKCLEEIYNEIILGNKVIEKSLNRNTLRYKISLYTSRKEFLNCLLISITNSVPIKDIQEKLQKLSKGYEELLPKTSFNNNLVEISLIKIQQLMCQNLINFNDLINNTSNISSKNQFLKIEEAMSIAKKLQREYLYRKLERIQKEQMNFKINEDDPTKIYALFYQSSIPISLCSIIRNEIVIKYKKFNFMNIEKDANGVYVLKKGKVYSFLLEFTLFSAINIKPKLFVDLLEIDKDKNILERYESKIRSFLPEFRVFKEPSKNPIDAETVYFYKGDIQFNFKTNDIAHYLIRVKSEDNLNSCSQSIENLNEIILPIKIRNKFNWSIIPFFISILGLVGAILLEYLPKPDINLCWLKILLYSIFGLLMLTTFTLMILEFILGKKQNK